LITGIHHKLHANKLSGFKGTSQGFLEDDMELADTGVLIPKIHASIANMSLQISQGKYTLFCALIFCGLRA
jgi:hypothetical protein